MKRLIIASLFLISPYITFGATVDEIQPLFDMVQSPYQWTMSDTMIGYSQEGFHTWYVASSTSLNPSLRLNYPDVEFNFSTSTGNGLYFFYYLAGAGNPTLYYQTCAGVNKSVTPDGSPGIFIYKGLNAWQLLHYSIPYSCIEDIYFGNLYPYSLQGMLYFTSDDYSAVNTAGEMDIMLGQLYNDYSNDSYYNWNYASSTRGISTILMTNPVNNSIVPFSASGVPFTFDLSVSTTSQWAQFRFLACYNENNDCSVMESGTFNVNKGTSTVSKTKYLSNLGLWTVVGYFIDDEGQPSKNAYRGSFIYGSSNASTSSSYVFNEGFLDNFAYLWPFGYFTDFWRLVNPNRVATSSSLCTLPVITYTIPSGLPGQGKSLVIDVNNSLDMLLYATSTYLGTNDTFFDITDYYFEKMLWFLAVIYMIARFVPLFNVSLNTNISNERIKRMGNKGKYKK